MASQSEHRIAIDDFCFANLTFAKDTEDSARTIPVVRNMEPYPAHTVASQQLFIRANPDYRKIHGQVQVLWGVKGFYDLDDSMSCQDLFALKDLLYVTSTVGSNSSSRVTFKDADDGNVEADLAMDRSEYTRHPYWNKSESIEAQKSRLKTSWSKYVTACKVEEEDQSSFNWDDDIVYHWQGISDAHFQQSPNERQSDIGDQEPPDKKRKRKTDSKTLKARKRNRGLGDNPFGFPVMCRSDLDEMDDRDSSTSDTDCLSSSGSESIDTPEPPQLAGKTLREALCIWQDFPMRQRHADEQDATKLTSQQSQLLDDLTKAFKESFQDRVEDPPSRDILLRSKWDYETWDRMDNSLVVTYPWWDLEDNVVEIDWDFVIPGLDAE